MVTVGSEQDIETWILLKKLLVSSSPFFKAALEGSFTEADSNSIALPEDNGNAFALFVHWVYYGGDSLDDVVLWSSTVFTRAWVLGDKLGRPTFQDLMMLCLVEMHREQPMDSEILYHAYCLSPAGSRLRQYALDEFRWDSSAGHCSDWADKAMSLTEDLEDLGRDYMQSHMAVSQENFKKPSERKEQYLIE